MSTKRTFLRTLVLSAYVTIVGIVPGVASDLLQAIQSGEGSKVSKLLSQSKHTVHDRFANGDTPILIAARRGDLKMVELLSAHGANINAQDDSRRDILNIAISTRNTELARLALRLGANPSAVTSIYDGGALIYGSAKGAVEIVKMLIRAGAPVNRVNNLGWTALLEVVLLGDGSTQYVAIARALLEAGADRNIADRDGNTPLVHAQRRRHQLLVKELVAQ